MYSYSIYFFLFVSIGTLPHLITKLFHLPFPTSIQDSIKSIIYISTYHIIDTNFIGIIITPLVSMHNDPLNRDLNIHYMYDSRCMVIPLPEILTYTKCMLVDAW
jgi:hypothetical protein